MPIEDAWRDASRLVIGSLGKIRTEPSALIYPSSIKSAWDVGRITLSGTSFLDPRTIALGLFESNAKGLLLMGGVNRGVQLGGGALLGIGYMRLGKQPAQAPRHSSEA